MATGLFYRPRQRRAIPCWLQYGLVVHVDVRSKCVAHCVVGTLIWSPFFSRILSKNIPKTFNFIFEAFQCNVRKNHLQSIFTHICPVPPPPFQRHLRKILHAEATETIVNVFLKGNNCQILEPPTRFFNC